MDNVTFQQIKEAIQKVETIGVVVGRNPTIDDMGAALALYLSLSQGGKNVVIASATEPIVEVSNLVGIDKVKNRIEGPTGDLIVSFPYQEGTNGEGEIQKVSYTIEDGFLNIVVKASEGGLSFSEKDVRYKKGGAGAPQLLFVVGTPRLTDLGELFNAEALKNTTVINVDNKADNQGFGDIVLVSPKYSSVSEQMANLLLSLNMNIDVDIAQNLMSGISYATDNFQKPNTSYLAFEMAATLMRKGAARNADLGTAYQAPSITSLQATQSASFNQQMGRNRQQPQPQRQFPQEQVHQPDSSFFTNPQPQQNQPMRNPAQPFPQHNPQPRQQNQPMHQTQSHQPHQQPSHQQPPQQVTSGQQSPKEFPRPTEQKGKNPPPDWLVPKVYKGSSEA